MCPQPLPTNSYNRSSEAPLHDAYEQCLQMEAGAHGDQDVLMLARCLGYLIRELGDNASELVANEIAACDGDFEEMSTLSRLYIDHLIRLFRRNKGCTPASSEHHSPPSFETHRNLFSEAVDPAPTDHKTAKKSALRRDNYRCVVSGLVDGSSYWSMKPEDLQRYNLPPQNPPLLTNTNYCHIFPPSTNWGFDPNDPAEKKRKYAGSVWAIIQSFGRIDVLSELDGGNIHRLENGFTMDTTLHMLFDDLLMWFEHITDNTYRVYTVRPGYLAFTYMPPGGIITFTSTDPSLSLPNPEYLKLHAAVCRVAHMSGAAGYLDLEDRRIESLEVLACDGSSADLLTSRLAHVALTAA